VKEYRASQAARLRRRAQRRQASTSHPPVIVCFSRQRPVKKRQRVLLLFAALCHGCLRCRHGAAKALARMFQTTALS